MKVLILLKISFEKTEKNHNEFSSQNLVISSQNNVPKYRIKGQEQFEVFMN